MINDPYLILELHRARVETLTEDVRAGRLARLIRRHASRAGETSPVAVRSAPRRQPA
ncbi:hypothetical protein O7635_35735 [Asanoa sp. WMMD1127]|uniref:hypothetical protein n=1 Tax=Asanoa sp. WMMD1127 TaxID=3016107 RepID=UPI002416997B|nr:hypothetical protein [Asanoa sp. WMMD1127]MDG4827228.1 hypothetical protein [Asanoa sp. WMMD1127]